jgi:NADPH:quinone reductase-like Zn-dependent oxidoreductase
MVRLMRQVQFSQFGGPDVLEIVERPTPQPGPRQALIRVRAAGINFFETLLRENRYAVTPELPCVPGVEIAGTVAAVGDEASLRVGTRVAVPLFAAGSFGGYADHALIDAALAVPLPDALSFETATALMVQGLTALALVREVPPRGKTILVSAAAGGVGSLLVQLAKRAGARKVIAAASSAPTPASTTRSRTGSTRPAPSVAAKGRTSSMSPSAAISRPHVSKRWRRVGSSSSTVPSTSSASTSASKSSSVSSSGTSR